MDADLDNNTYHMFLPPDENLPPMFECLVLLEHCKENEAKILSHLFKETACEETKHAEAFVKKTIETRTPPDNGIHEMPKFENQGGNLSKRWPVEQDPGKPAHSRTENEPI